MALSKENTHIHPSTSWEYDNDVRAGSGPFGSPDGRLASRKSPSHHAFDEEVSALQRSARPRRRDLMAGSRPRPIVPKSLSEAYRIAQAVCAAKMAPKGLDTPEACMIAIMHGLEVGLSPLSALQRIAVINGRPTIWGDGALALVKASGLCEAIEEWIEGDDPHTWIAVCNLIRKHDPVPVERRFSTEDAKRAKLWGKAGPWSDYPKRMLQMRARAFALRDAFPDVLGGLYLTEEFVAEPETEAQLAPHFETETPSVADAGVGRVEENQHQASNGFTRGSFNNTPTGDVNYERGSGPLDVSVEATQAWYSKAASRDEYARSANEQPNPQTATTQVGLDGSLNAAFEETDNTSATTAITGERELPITARLPPLANLRRTRSMPRDVRALRFRNQWSIKQPRGPRKELSQTNAVSSDQGHATSSEGQSWSSSSLGHVSSHDRMPTPQTHPLPTQRQCTSEQGVAPQTTTRSPAFIPADDITAHLDLYDAALCCATDPDTLIEIAEEFTERLSQLPRSSRNDAELIFEKHQTRIGTAPTYGGRHD